MNGKHQTFFSCCHINLLLGRITLQELQQFATFC